MAVHPSPVRSNFLKGTTSFDAINNFYKLSIGPEAVPPQILRKVGRMQVTLAIRPHRTPSPTWPDLVICPASLSLSCLSSPCSILSLSQVLADLGAVSVMMRLVTKLVDDNFFAALFAALATSMPDYKRLAGKAGMSTTSLRRWI